MYIQRKSLDNQHTQGIIMNSQVDIIVIGGGVNGASVAMQLSNRTKGSLALFDKGGLGSGATGRSGAMIREHYLTPELVRMASDAKEFFESWQRLAFDPQDWSLGYFDDYEFEVDGQLRTLSKDSLLDSSLLQFYKEKFNYFINNGLDDLQRIKAEHGLTEPKEIPSLSIK